MCSYSSYRLRLVSVMVVACWSLSTTTLFAAQPVPELSTQEQAELNQSIAELQAQLPELQAAHVQLQDEFGQLKQELQHLLAEMDVNDDGWFRGFRNELLASVPVKVSTARYDWSIGIYGKDVLQAFFIAAGLVVDYVLYKRICCYYSKNVSNNFYQKKQMLIALIRDKYQNGSMIGSSLKKVVMKEVEAIFAVEKSITIKLFLNILVYLLSNESVAYLEHSVFPVKGGSFFSRINRLIQNLSQDQDRLVWPIPPIWAHEHNERYVVPVAGMALDLFAWNYKGTFAHYESFLPTIRSMCLKLAGLHHPCLDTNWFNFVKRMIVLLRFLQQSNTLYKKLCNDFLLKNSDKFFNVLNQMAYPAIANKPLPALEDDLQNLATEAHTYAFLHWVKFKNSCLANTDFCIEMVLMLPALCKAAYLAYQSFETV